MEQMSDTKKFKKSIIKITDDLSSIDISEEKIEISEIDNTRGIINEKSDIRGQPLASSPYSTYMKSEYTPLSSDKAIPHGQKHGMSKKNSNLSSDSTAHANKSAASKLGALTAGFKIEDTNLESNIYDILFTNRTADSALKQLPHEVDPKIEPSCIKENAYPSFSLSPSFLNPIYKLRAAQNNYQNSQISASSGSPVLSSHRLISPSEVSTEGGPVAALWPRQPNQFAFSQEDEEAQSESDEAYSEINIGDSVTTESDSGGDGDDIVYDISSPRRNVFRGEAFSSDSELCNESTENHTFNFEEEHDSHEEEDDDEYEVMELRIFRKKNRTGFEPTKELEPKIGSCIGNRYKICEYIGEAAFSTTYKCIDKYTGGHVCLKIIKNNKEYLDQGFDEIRILSHMNQYGNLDEMNIVQLIDYFYIREHLILVFELLGHNLYDFSRMMREEALEENFFDSSRLRKITRECLKALKFIHSLNIIHCDLKPENILLKSYSKCSIKVIDFGSSCYSSDEMTVYIQSRSYRSPEVLLGMEYNHKIDIWSLGCIISELFSGNVLFNNSSVQSILEKIISILGPIPEEMLERGSEVSKYFMDTGELYQKTVEGDYCFIYPIKSCLEDDLHNADELFIDFIRQCLQIQPELRPSADEALRHPWLQCDVYE